MCTIIIDWGQFMDVLMYVCMYVLYSYLYLKKIQILITSNIDNALFLVVCGKPYKRKKYRWTCKKKKSLVRLNVLIPCDFPWDISVVSWTLPVLIAQATTYVNPQYLPFLFAHDGVNPNNSNSVEKRSRSF